MTFAVFDIETRVDKALLNRAFFAGQGLDDESAWARYRDEMRARRAGDFAPITLHVPISIAIGEVGADHVLRAVESLSANERSEEGLVREFWTRAERFSGALVSFNGRRFDLPVLELCALRHAIAIPAHFAEGGARSRYSEARHIDVFDLLTNYGAVRLAGGLNLLLRMIGMPGKTDIAGGDVQGLYEAGRREEIDRYCRGDVIRTYLLFLRVQLMRGRIDERAYNLACAAAEPFVRLIADAGGGQES